MCYSSHVLSASHPQPYARFKHIQRERAALHHYVMENADVKLPLIISKAEREINRFSEVIKETY